MYCKACVEELRLKGVDKSCPLCRKPLPPGPEKLYDLGYGIYWKVKGAIDRSRPGVAPETPWPALSTKQQREMDQAVALLREAADQGHMRAQTYCGDLYWFGSGVAKDDHLAVVYYEKAARQGDANAQCSLGYAYDHGEGVPQNEEKAFELYHQSAAQGDSCAQCNLGNFYRDGTGCEQNYECAAEWYEKAALQGYAGALDSLGSLYYNGTGVPPNRERAVELYRQSVAIDGDAITQYNLAVSRTISHSTKLHNPTNEHASQ